ncbi:hypothetical protein Tco_0651129 [Tanacetum coccineum]
MDFSRVLLLYEHGRITMDVKTEFLLCNGKCGKMFYVSSGWVRDKDIPITSIKLKESSLFGLKQAQGVLCFDSCDPVDTPVVEKSKLDEDKEGKAVDPSHYRGSFRNLKGTDFNRGLWYPKDSSIALTAFADADHAGCQDTRHSTSGSMQLLGDRLVSWSSKRQKSVAISSTEAEYIALSGFSNFRFQRLIGHQFSLFIKEHVENGLGMRSFTPETLKQLADEVDE